MTARDIDPRAAIVSALPFSYTPTEALSGWPWLGSHLRCNALDAVAIWREMWAKCEKEQKS